MILIDGIKVLKKRKKRTILFPTKNFFFFYIQLTYSDIRSKLSKKKKKKKKKCLKIKQSSKTFQNIE